MPEAAAAIGSGSPQHALWRGSKERIIRVRLTNLIEDGKYYKGNLHCHSTYSDGTQKIEVLAQAYKEKGYDFVAFTDHNIFADWKNLCDESFLALRGFEGNLEMHNEGREFHFVVIPGTPEALKNAVKPCFGHLERVPVREFSGLETAQEFIDDMLARGFQVIFAHPHWSTIEYDDVVQLKGLVACEVFNNSSYKLLNMGESCVFWDAVMRRGPRLWGVASDDNHNFEPFGTIGSDSFGGFVQVKAKSLSEEDICSSIAAGSFYASTGPEIYDFYVEGNEAFLSCSPVSRIYFNGERRQFTWNLAEPGQHVESHRGKIYPGQTYIRAEIYDEYGRKAYANPIFLK